MYFISIAHKILILIALSSTFSCAVLPWKTHNINVQPDFTCRTGGAVGYEIYGWKCLENQRVIVYQQQAEMIVYPAMKETSNCNQQTNIEIKLNINEGRANICSPARVWNSGN